MIVGPAWLRLALAVFVFVCFSSLALVAGPAAVADEPSSPSGTSSTDTKPGTKPDGKPEPRADKADEADGIDKGKKPGRKVGFTSDDKANSGIESTPVGEGKDAVRTKPTRRSEPDTPGDVSVGTKPQPAQELPSDGGGTPQPAADNAPPSAPETPPAEPNPELPPTTESDESINPPHESVTPPLESAPTDAPQRLKSPRRPAPVEPPGTAAYGRLGVVAANPVGPSDSSAAGPAELSSRQDAKPLAPESFAALVPSDVASLPPAPPPSLARAAAGFISDVGTITVSVVHMAATVVAQAFGPDTFLGVPYLLATSVANAAAAVGRTIAGGTLAPPSSGPLHVEYGILDGLAFFNPTKPPAGANLPPSEAPPERPLPVILVNGTVLTQGLNWSVGAPVLANAGYEVYTFNYGNSTPFPGFPIQSTGDIAKSAEELSAFVDQVRLETGSDKVILVGHSQGGGILPAYYINNLDGADKVAHVIGIAPSNHGTDFNGLALFTRIPVLGPLTIGVLDAIAPAFTQQLVGSPFQEEVYGNGDTRPGPRYTNIVSANDWIVTPYTQQPLDGPNVTNIVLQQVYPTAVIGHANIVLSPLTWAQVLAALEADEQANPQPVNEPAQAAA